MWERLSSRCWDVTTISGMLPVAASVASAIAVVLVTNNARAAVTPDVAARVGKLDIKDLRKKLERSAPRPKARAVLAQGGDLSQGGRATASRSGNRGV